MSLRLTFAPFLTILVMLASFAQAAPNLCLTAANPSRPRLGIGVLVLDTQGHAHLAVGPYTGNSHQRLLDALFERNSSIRSVRWMGELHYEAQHGHIRITEANETSGSYTALVAPDSSLAKRGVEVQNHVSALPAAALATGFQGVSFGKGPLRLDEQLNQMGDVRHDAANALSGVQAMVIRLSLTKYSENQKRETLADFRLHHLPILDRLNWVFNDLLSQHRLDLNQIKLLKFVCHELGSPMPDLHGLEAVDQTQLFQELMYMTHILTGQDQPATQFFDF